MKYSRFVLQGCLATSGLVLLLTATTRAALLVSEPFNYQADTALTGENGGTGFSAAYTLGTMDFPSTGGSATVVLSGDGASLSYPSSTIAASPVGAHISDNFSTNPGVTHADARKLTAGFNMSSTTFYVSYLVQIDNSGAFKIDLTNSSNSEKFRTGVSAAGKLICGTTTDNATTESVPTGQPVLIVSKFVASSSGLLNSESVYAAGTSIPTSDPGTYDVSKTGSASGVTDNVLDIDITGGSVQLDELRFGDAWADVVPTPEPGAAILLAPFAIGLLCRRRRAADAQRAEGTRAS